MTTATPSKPVGLNPSAKPLKQGNNRLPLIIAAVAAAIVLVGAIIYAVGRPDEALPLNADTITMVKYINEPAYQKLPFARQQLYMKVLEDRDDNDELKDAFDAGKITEDQFRAASLEAWLGQQLKRSEKFNGYSNEQARLRYVRELLDKKDEKDQRKAQKTASGAPKQDKPSDAVKRDESLEQLRVDAWPSDVRSKWQAFRTAYESEKETATAPPRRQSLQ
jgi:hypothetical protein